MHVHQTKIFDMAFDWLVAMLPANQKPGLKILVN